MFDPGKYKTACARLKLGQEKMEEMILMIKQMEKRRLRRPIRAALLAAAIVAVLCITAVAAVPLAREAVLSFFGFDLAVTVTEQGAALGVKIPDLSLQDADGRILLTVDGETVDITDDLTEEGYLYRKDYDDCTLEIQLDPDLSCFTILCDKQDGSPVIVFSKPAPAAKKAGAFYEFATGGEDDGTDSVTIVDPMPAAETD